jgi:hypothetical protein
MKGTRNPIGIMKRFYHSRNPFCGFRLSLSLALACLAPITHATQITGTATKCSGLASCYFALTGTGGTGWASTIAFVGGYVGQSPLNFRGTISFLLPGEANPTYNGSYQGQAVLAGYSSTAGTLYHVTGTFSALDANTGTFVTGSTDTLIGIKGHSGRGGGIFFTLVHGSIMLNKSTSRASSTTLVCNPSSLSPGGSTTCTVTVNDPGAGSASTPKGTVTFTQSSAVPGTFHPAASCTLVGGTGSVTFTVNPEGDGYYVRLTASYGGDSVHEGSAASVNVYVSAGTDVSSGTDN